MLRDIFFGKEKNFTPKLLLFHAALILVSFAFVYIFSYSTSFRYSLLGGDSAVFQVMGKYWLEGVVPYKDLFDHKGPIVYVVNALGYAIYPRSGIMVPQTIFLYGSCLFIWRAMELYSASAWKIFFMLLTLIYYAAHYEEGNHVAEYSVLFLSAAAYCFLRALKDSEGKKFFHPPLYGFIYGFGFGACFLIRLSDAAQICCQTFLVAIFLLQTRDFKNLRQNVLSFCAGFATILLPFVIYFAAHGALYDALYGIILFNIKYAQINPYRLFIYHFLYSLIHYMPLCIMIIIAIFALKQNPKNQLLQSGLFIGTMIILILLKLRPVDQYVMIFLPIAPIFFAVFKESKEVIQKIWQNQGLNLQKIIIKVLIVLTVIDLYIMAFYVKFVAFSEKTLLSVFFTSYNKCAELLNLQEREYISKLQAMIPENEKKSFACWGDYRMMPHWILYTDMKPHERFFMNTTVLSLVDSRLKDEWLKNVNNSPPKWILYDTNTIEKKYYNVDEHRRDFDIENLLAKKYTLHGEAWIYDKVMKLYRLKD